MSHYGLRINSDTTTRDKVLRCARGVGFAPTRQQMESNPCYHTRAARASGTGRCAARASLGADFGDDQLSGPFATFGDSPELGAELGIARLFAHVRQTLCDVRLVDLGVWRHCGGRQTGGPELQSFEIGTRQSWRLRDDVAELRAKVNSGERPE